MAYTGLQREKKPLTHRRLRSRLVPALVIGPALAVSLCNPLVAFAAETEELGGATAVAQPQVIYTEDIFSTNAGFEQSVSDAVEAVGQDSFETEIVITDSTEEYVASSEIALTDSNTSTPDSGGVEYQNVDTDTCSQHLETEFEQQDFTAQEVTILANSNTALKMMSSEPTQSLGAQAESDGVTHYDSHTASITYSAGDGGSITPGSAQQEQNTSSDGKTTITENFADSLAGASGGARAVADEGFHFVKWIDSNSGNTLSTSEYFVPERPEEGWPRNWRIQAVFARNVYQIRLYPNGGKSEKGTVSGGFIALDIVLGSGFRLPANGTEFAITKVGSSFSGWNTVPDPGGGGVSTSLAVEDGAHLVRGAAQLLHEVEDGVGVDVAHAGSHDHALERGESHGGIHALAVLDGANGTAGADVASDYL